MPIQIEQIHKIKYPFLTKWLGQRVREIEGLPKNTQRSGVSKGDIFPLTRPKALFAVFEALRGTVQVNLRDLASIFEISYETIRHWRSNRQIKEATSKFVQKFVDDFIAEILKNQKEEIKAVRNIENLMEEAVKFRNHILRQFLMTLKAMISAKGSSSQFLAVVFAKHAMRFIEMDSSQELKDFLEVANKAYEDFLGTFFDMLGGAIQAGDEEAAIYLLEGLRRETLDTAQALNWIQQKFWGAENRK